METVRLPLHARSLPDEGVVDVWLADLSRLPLDAGPGGNSRRSLLARRRIQQQFFLRLLLGAYLGCPGKAVRIGRGKHGKPELCGDHVDGALRFNLSHSAHWLAIAISRGLPVGIDIEAERRLPRAAALARRFLSSAEADWLERLDEPFRSQQFLHQWTAREALVKAMGCGLAGCLAELELDWRPPAIRRLPAGWPPADCWHLHSPALPDSLSGHVALPSPCHRVELRHLAAAPNSTV